MASELRVDRIIPTSGVPTGGGGGIVQVKYVTMTSAYSDNLNNGAIWSFNNDLLRCTITAKKSTNLFIVTGQIVVGSNGLAVNAMVLLLQRLLVIRLVIIRDELLLVLIMATRKVYLPYPSMLLSHQVIQHNISIILLFFTMLVVNNIFI